MTGALQVATAAASCSVLRALGFAAERTGTVIDGFAVQAECSGARSMIVLAVIAAVFCKGWRLRAVPLALFLAFAANVARVMAIVIASRCCGPAAAAAVHDYAGYALFMVAACAMTCIDSAVTRGKVMR